MFFFPLLTEECLQTLISQKIVGVVQAPASRLLNSMSKHLRKLLTVMLDTRHMI